LFPDAINFSEAINDIELCRNPDDDCLPEAQTLVADNVPGLHDIRNWLAVDKSMDQLSCATYWSRVWVAQEIVSARRIALLFNSVPLELDAISRLQNMLQIVVHDIFIGGGQFTPSWFDRYSSQELQQRMAMAAMLDENTRGLIDKFESPKQDLLDVLQKYGTSECADPRDRIFATMAFVDWSKSLYQLTPSYTVHKWELMMDLVEWRLNLETNPKGNLAEFTFTLATTLGIGAVQLRAITKPDNRLSMNETTALARAGRLCGKRRSKIRALEARTWCEIQEETDYTVTLTLPPTHRHRCCSVMKSLDSNRVGSSCICSGDLITMIKSGTRSTIYRRNDGAAGLIYKKAHKWDCVFPTTLVQRSTVSTVGMVVRSTPGSTEIV
jgi:hypothetical protein